MRRKNRLKPWPASTTPTLQRLCAAARSASATPPATPPSRSAAPPPAHSRHCTRGPNQQSVPFQCGSSKVVYVGNIPSSSFSDESILKLAQPFGKVCKYFTNRIKREVRERRFNPNPQPVTAGGGSGWRKRQKQILQFASVANKKMLFFLSSGVHRNGERRGCGEDGRVLQRKVSEVQWESSDGLRQQEVQAAQTRVSLFFCGGSLSGRLPAV